MTGYKTPNYLLGPVIPPCLGSLVNPTNTPAPLTVTPFAWGPFLNPTNTASPITVTLFAYSPLGNPTNTAPPPPPATDHTNPAHYRNNY